MCRSFCVFSSFRKTSRSTVAGWDDKSFVRSVFRSACNILRSYQQRNGVSAAPRLSPRSLLSAFWILAVLLATSLSLLGPVWCCPESVCNWRGDCSYVTYGQIRSLFPWLFESTPLCPGELHPCEACSCRVSVQRWWGVWISTLQRQQPYKGQAPWEGGMWSVDSGVTRTGVFLQGWREKALDAFKQGSRQHMWWWPSGPSNPE